MIQFAQYISNGLNPPTVTSQYSQAQASVELRDGSMNTPLISAASHGHVEAGVFGEGFLDGPWERWV